MATALEHHLFTSNEYHRMIDSGILTEDDRVELLHGEVVRMAAVGRRHAACVNDLGGKFAELFSKEAIISIQNPVWLNDHSEPEPDIALLHKEKNRYFSRLPQAQDVYLIVEVADTTIERDRNIKIPMYARAGIAEVWLVDLTKNVVEIHTVPSEHGYQNVQYVHPGGKLKVMALGGDELDVNEILGLS